MSRPTIVSTSPGQLILFQRYSNLFPDSFSSHLNPLAAKKDFANAHLRSKETFIKNLITFTNIGDPHKVKIGVERAMEFYSWVETRFGFPHNKMTCREMACVLARGNRLKVLWDFLHEMARKGENGVVTTATLTCLIKVLGEEGLVNQALAAFYRMKQFHCKPDLYAYNTIIYALSQVGNLGRQDFC